MSGGIGRPRSAHFREGEGLAAKVGRRIRHRRRMMGLTQADVAKGTGVQFQAVQKWECGICDISLSRLEMIAKTLSIPLIELVSE